MQIILPPDGGTAGRIERLRRHLLSAVLWSGGLVVAAALIHRYVTPLPPALVALGRPLGLALGAAAGAAEALRFAGWGAGRAPVMRWARPVGGAALCVLAFLARAGGERFFGDHFNLLVGGAAALAGGALLVDAARALRGRHLSPAAAAGAAAGALGLMVLAGLVGAYDAAPDRTWRVLFLLSLALLTAGGLTFARLRRGAAADPHSAPEA